MVPFRLARRLVGVRAHVAAVHEHVSEEAGDPICLVFGRDDHRRGSMIYGISTAASQVQ